MRQRSCSVINTEPSAAKAPAIFMDRDGTLNIDHGYVHTWEEWNWIDGAKEAVKIVNEMGYRLVVVTNQSGIARKLYDHEEVIQLHRRVIEDLKQDGLTIDSFYWCPHHEDITGVCTCRKPDSGLLERAAAELNIDLSQSWMIGDKASDVRAGQSAGCRSLLVETGYGRQEVKDASTSVFSNVLRAVEHIFND